MLEQLSALIEKHCTTLTVELESVRNCLDRLDGSDQPVAEVIAEGIGLAHKIKGSSGSIGFPEISAAAALLERHLRSLAELDETLSPAQRDQVFAHYDGLARLIRQVSPEASTLYNAQFPLAVANGR